MPRLSDIWAQAGVDVRGFLTLVLILLVALVLGRLLAGRLHALPVHSRSEYGLIWILIGVVACSWIGVFLAALQLFRWWAAVGALIAAVLVAQRTLRGRAGAELQVPALPQTPRLAVWAVLALLAASLWIYARPAESFFVADDSAVYTLAGIVLAREGGLLAHPPSFWPTTSEFARLFYVHNLSGMMSRFYGPFYQHFLNIPALEIGFLPLPKVWSALAVWLLGAARATWSTPIFGVLGLAAFYGLIRRAMSWQVALLSTLLLAISLPQIWFARYPISEAYAQAIVFGGLYLALLMDQNRADARLSRQLAFWSAACLALWSMIRLEAVVLLPLLTVLLLLGWGRAAWAAPGAVRTWLGSLTLLSLAGWAISLVTSRYYLFDHSLGLLKSQSTPLVAWLVLLVGIGGLLVYRTWSRIRGAVLGWSSRVQQWLPAVAFVIWVAWGLLCIARLLSDRFTNSVPGWMTYYLSPLGVLLALGGILWLMGHYLRRGSGRAEVIALLLLAGLLLVLYTVRPMVVGNQPWAVRRLVPMILPLFALGAGTLIATAIALPTRRTDRRFARWLVAGGAAVLLLAQVSLEVRAGRPIVLHREQGGFAAQMQPIAAALPRDAVLLFDNGLTAQGLPQAFELWFNLPALALRETPAGSAQAMLDELIEAAHADGRPVYFIVTDGDLDWHPEQWAFVSRGTQQIETAVLRPPSGRAPVSDDIVARPYLMDVYEILPKEEAQPGLPVVVGTSTGTYPYLRDGFYGLDQGVEGKIARWTDGVGSIVLPWPAAGPGEPADVCLSLAVAGGRPEDRSAAEFTVRVEGVPIYQGELPKDFAPHEVRALVEQISNTGLPELEIDLVSTTWDATAAGDARELGVLFYGLQMLPAAACSATQ